MYIGQMPACPKVDSKTDDNTERTLLINPIKILQDFYQLSQQEQKQWEKEISG